jgi:hypothetical protein
MWHRLRTYRCASSYDQHATFGGTEVRGRNDQCSRQWILIERFRGRYDRLMQRSGDKPCIRQSGSKLLSPEIVLPHVSNPQALPNRADLALRSFDSLTDIVCLRLVGANKGIWSQGFHLKVECIVRGNNLSDLGVDSRRLGSDANEGPQRLRLQFDHKSM